MYIYRSNHSLAGCVLFITTKLFRIICIKFSHNWNQCSWTSYFDRIARGNSPFYRCHSCQSRHTPSRTHPPLALRLYQSCLYLHLPSYIIVFWQLSTFFYFPFLNPTERIFLFLKIVFVENVEYRTRWKNIRPLDRSPEKSSQKQPCYHTAWSAFLYYQKRYLLEIYTF